MGVLAIAAAAAAGDTLVVGAAAAVVVEGVVLWLVAAAAAAAGIHVRGVQQAVVDQGSVVVADHVVVGVVAGEARGLDHCRVGRRVNVERRREMLVQEGSSLLL